MNKINLTAIIALTLLTAFTEASFGQQTFVSQPTSDKIDYLKKSKRQKTAGWIFTGVGSAILLTTLTVDAFTSAFSGFQESASGIAVPYAIGAASVVTGVVFLVASGKNKKKAKASVVFIDIEKTPVLLETAFRNQSFPVLGLKINL